MVHRMHRSSVLFLFNGENAQAVILNLSNQTDDAAGANVQGEDQIGSLGLGTGGFGLVKILSDRK